MNKTIKIILIAGGVVVLLALGFYFFSSSDKNNSAIIKNPAVNSPADSSNATAFLTTLLSLNKIKVDTTIFKNPIFTRLKDNTVPILNEGGVGRPNPFAELDNTTPVDNGMTFPQINNGVSTKNTTPQN